jgi:hypothetical protein
LLSVVSDRLELRWLRLALHRFGKLAASPELAALLRSTQNASVVEDIMATIGIYSDRTLPRKAE